MLCCALFLTPTGCSGFPFEGWVPAAGPLRAQRPPFFSWTGASLRSLPAKPRGFAALPKACCENPHIVEDPDGAVGKDKEKNPNATPEQRTANLATEKANLDKAEADLQAKKARYDAALKQADAKK